jgi:hypothetical protein
VEPSNHHDNNFVELYFRRPTILWEFCKIDPLASHIFVSRRNYRNVNDTKSGKRREMTARLSFNTACELSFRGGLDEWNRLMGAVARR